MIMGRYTEEIISTRQTNIPNSQLKLVPKYVSVQTQGRKQEKVFQFESKTNRLVLFDGRKRIKLRRWQIAEREQETLGLCLL